MRKNLEAIKNQEKMMREELFIKTANLLHNVLVYVPTSTLLQVNGMPIKVIVGSDGRKSLLINHRPLSTLGDCEWVIDNFDALNDAVDEVMNPEAEEILKIIEKTQGLIKRVDELNSEN